MSITSPFVSIVINSYNQAAFLEQTIRSVLEQNYRNIEIILVDGGSTDGSLEIINQYSKHFSWWVSEKDSGQAEGLNKGLKRAKGDLVAWLNSDDYYLPETITRAVESWRSQPKAVLIYGDVLAVDENNRPLNRMLTGNWQLDDLMEFNIINQPAVFMNRTGLEASGYLDENFHYLLDHHLWLRIASLGKLVHVPELWAAGRFHPAAKNISAAVMFGEEAYHLVDWMEQTLPFKSLAEGRWHHIIAGAHRINARYLLEGGDAVGAIKSYWLGLRTYPPIVLPETLRMIYALLSMIGFGKIKHIYYSLRKLVRPVKMD